MEIHNVKGINSTQPLQNHKIELASSELYTDYKAAYIPSVIYDQFCSTGLCKGRYLNYLA